MFGSNTHHRSHVALSQGKLHGYLVVASISLFLLLVHKLVIQPIQEGPPPLETPPGGVGYPVEAPLY